MSIQQFKIAITEIYAAVASLRNAFPGRKFTPDGRMIGDIGEAIAGLEYDMQLDGVSRRDWDAVWNSSEKGRVDVQIRATQGNNTYIKQSPHEGTLLLFHLLPTGEWQEIYNGSTARAWEVVAHQKSKEKNISLARLRALQKSSDSFRVPKRIAL